MLNSACDGAWFCKLVTKRVETMLPRHEPHQLRSREGQRRVWAAEPAANCGKQIIFARNARDACNLLQRNSSHIQLLRALSFEIFI
jgi:hypothetical protein